LIVAALIGMAAGVGVYTFVYAKGYSYLTNDPASCANCHIMNEQYDGWLKSSHRAAGSRAHSGRINQLFTPGPEFIARQRGIGKQTRRTESRAENQIN